MRAAAFAGRGAISWAPSDFLMIRSDSDHWNLLFHLAFEFGELQETFHANANS